MKSCNKNGGQGNFRGERRRINKSNMKCFVCQKFGHFARERNENKNEPEVDEVKVARQEFDEENTFLVIITEGGCCSNRLRNSCNNNFGNDAEPCCNRLSKYCNR